MSDIVERLLNDVIPVGSVWEIRQEAAAEIERLRADHQTTLDRIEYALRSHQSVIGAACKGCLELALEKGIKALEGE